jgi:hypothetical protein
MKVPRHAFSLGRASRSETRPFTRGSPRSRRVIRVSPPGASSQVSGVSIAKRPSAVFPPGWGACSWLSDETRRADRVN